MGRSFFCRLARGFARAAGGLFVLGLGAGCGPPEAAPEGPGWTASGAGRLIEVVRLAYGTAPDEVGFNAFRDEWIDQGPMSFDVFDDQLFLLDTANRRILIRPLSEAAAGRYPETLAVPEACWLQDLDVGPAGELGATGLPADRPVLQVFDLCHEATRTLDLEAGRWSEPEPMAEADAFMRFGRPGAAWSAERMADGAIRITVRPPAGTPYALTVEGRPLLEQAILVRAVPDGGIVEAVLRRSTETELREARSVGFFGTDGSLRASFRLPVERTIVTPGRDVRFAEGALFWMAPEKDGVRLYRLYLGEGASRLF